MKAYLYNATTGVYEGETFEEADILQYENGLTTIPPPDYVPGEVPVFDREKSSWTLVPVTIARQLLKIGPEEIVEKN